MQIFFRKRRKTTVKTVIAPQLKTAPVSTRLLRLHISRGATVVADHLPGFAQLIAAANCRFKRTSLAFGLRHC